MIEKIVSGIVGVIASITGLHPLAQIPATAQLAAVAALPPGVTDTITITNASGSTQTNYPLQFGRPFVQGEIDHYPQVLIGGSPVLTQADVKNRHADGSVKFAIISVIVPSIPSAGSLTLSFKDQSTGNNTPLTKTEMLDSAYDFDAIIKITPPGVPGQSASARTMLQNGNCKVWTSGPVAQTMLCADDSTARVYDMGKDSHKSIRPRFYATFWPATHQVQVRYIAENSNTIALQNEVYDVSLGLGASSPTAVYNESGVAHSFLTRWTKLFWIGGTPEPRINIDNNLGYLAATKYIPNFDTSMQVPSGTIAGRYSNWLSKPRTKINDSGILTTYMPTTGGRSDIGPIPGWTADWLFSNGDWRARAIALGTADLAGGWPAFAREGDPARKIDKAKTISGLGMPISGYGHSDINWFPDNNGGYDMIALERRPSTNWVFEIPHQPDIFYTQYILTGDYSYLEGIQAFASMNTLSQSRGYTGGFPVLIEQERGNAWGLRNAAHAAFATPDADTAVKGYFTSITNDIIAFFDGRFNVTADGNTSTPEWKYANTNAYKGLNPLSMGTCTVGDKDCNNGLWQQYYFITAAGGVAERGFKAQGLADYLGEGLAGQIAAIPSGYYPYNFAGYYVNITDSNGVMFPTWVAAQTANIALGNMYPATKDPAQIMGGAYYGALGVAAAAYITSDSGATWNWMNTNIKQAALAGSSKVPGWYKGFYDGTGGELGWNIMPRGATPALPPPPPLPVDVVPLPDAETPVASTISSVVITQATPNQFTLSNLSCTPSSTSATSCTAKVSFTPTKTGVLGAVLVAKDSAGVTQTIPLTGTGVGVATTDTPPTTGGNFTIGAAVHTNTSGVNVRSEPTSSAGIRLQLAANVSGTVLGGPESSNGYVWYRVNFPNTNSSNDGTTGWVVQTYLSAGAVTPTQTDTPATGTNGGTQTPATTDGTCSKGTVSGTRLTGTSGNDCLVANSGVYSVAGGAGTDTLKLNVPSATTPSDWYVITPTGDNSYRIKESHASGYTITVSSVERITFPLGDTKTLSATSGSGDSSSNPTSPAGGTETAPTPSQTIISVPFSVHSVTGTGTYNIAVMDWGEGPQYANPSWFTFFKNSDGSYTIQDIHATGYLLRLTNVQEVIFPDDSRVVLSTVKLSKGLFPRIYAFFHGNQLRAEMALHSWGRGLRLALFGEGRGANTAAVIQFSASSVNFGSVNIGSTATQNVTVTVGR